MPQPLTPQPPTSKGPDFPPLPQFEVGRLGLLLERLRQDAALHLAPLYCRLQKASTLSVHPRPIGCFPSAALSRWIQRLHQVSDFRAIIFTNTLEQMTPASPQTIDACPRVLQPRTRHRRRHNGYSDTTQPSLRGQNKILMPGLPREPTLTILPQSLDPAYRHRFSLI